MLTNSCNCKMDTFFQNQADRSNHRFPPPCFYLVILRMLKIENMVVYHLPQIRGNSCWDVNGKRFCGLSHWKIPGTNRNSEKVVPFSPLGEFRMEIRLPFTSFLSFVFVSCCN